MDPGQADSWHGITTRLVGETWHQYIVILYRCMYVCIYMMCIIEDDNYFKEHLLCVSSVNIFPVSISYVHLVTLWLTGGIEQYCV